jgi:1-acyl-sn-glycerol-3-phosphate acyltransferase
MKTKIKDKGTVPFRIFKAILGPIFNLYYNPKVSGKENIPAEGPILLVGNHKHIMDQCAPLLSTKRGARYMAKKEYFDDKKVAWFFKAAGCIPVDRSKKDEDAKAAALEVLRNGGAIGLFPEGTRNKTDAFLLPFKFGAVSMAQKTDAYLVPFGISGDYCFRSKNLRIKFGKPFKVGDMPLEEANEKLAQVIGDLMREGMEETKGIENKKKRK